MARAHSIRIVQDADKNVVAAFTVKHELNTWLLSHCQPGYSTTVVRDGGH